MSRGSIRVYGTPWCGDCRRARAWLDQEGIAYLYIDIERDSASRRYVEQLNDGKRIIPTIVFPEGDVLVEPSNRELAARLGRLAGDSHG